MGAECAVRARACVRACVRACACACACACARACAWRLCFFAIVRGRVRACARAIARAGAERARLCMAAPKRHVFARSGHRRARGRQSGGQKTSSSRRRRRRRGSRSRSGGGGGGGGRSRGRRRAGRSNCNGNSPHVNNKIIININNTTAAPCNPIVNTASVATAGGGGWGYPRRHRSLLLPGRLSVDKPRH